MLYPAAGPTASTLSGPTSVRICCEMSAMSVFATLRDSTFRWFWLGMSLSTTGYWMQTITVSWLMRSWTEGDAVMVSLVQTAMFLPVFLFSLPAGVLADRVDRHKLLIVVHLVMGATPLGIAALVAFDWHHPIALLVLTAILAVGNAVKLPSQSAMVPDLVAADRLAAALSLNSIAVNGGRIVGPAITGILMPFLGAAQLLVLNATTYLGFVGVLLHVRNVVPKHTSRVPGRLTSDVAALFRYARGEAAYRAILLRGGFYFATWSLTLVVLPLLARDAAAFGQIYAYFGVGAIGGALFVARIRAHFDPSATLGFAIGLNILAIGLIPLWPTTGPMSALMLLTGIASFMGMNSLQLSAQTILPREFRGRGLALMNMIFMGGTAAASPIWGSIARATSATAAIYAACIFSIVAFLATRHLPISKPVP